jgi:hypothetical protein
MTQHCSRTWHLHEDKQCEVHWRGGQLAQININSCKNNPYFKGNQNQWLQLITTLYTLSGFKWFTFSYWTAYATKNGLTQGIEPPRKKWCLITKERISSTKDSKLKQACHALLSVPHKCYIPLDIYKACKLTMECICMVLPLPWVQNLELYQRKQLPIHWLPLYNQFLKLNACWQVQQ